MFHMVDNQHHDKIKPGPIPQKTEKQSSLLEERLKQKQVLSVVAEF